MFKLFYFFPKLFSTKKSEVTFPKISLGYRCEDIVYETENDSIYIHATLSDEVIIEVASIHTWNKAKRMISEPERIIIFENILAFVNKKLREKPIIIIRKNHQEGFWTLICEQNNDKIKIIEHNPDYSRF